jgi:uncharacterized iron-regulated protein
MNERSIARRAGLALLLAAGCAHRPCSSTELGPAAYQREWVSTLGRDHPLVGRIWDVRQARAVEARTLEDALATADFVLLGETHDNPDHHLMQARLVRALVDHGRRPAVAFEMLDTNQQAAVDAALKGPAPSADAIADAVRWSRSGWPSFSIYRPVFAAAVDEGLPIVAANLARARIEELVDQGPSALPPRLREEVERPLPDDVALAMRDEMRNSHCGKLPEDILDPMVLGQRARDAQMTDRLVASGRDGAVLIAGTGHARTDRGVPAALAHAAPGKKVLSVAFIEVSPDGCAPEDYAASFGAKALPFDYVVFTPGTQREDPCKGMKTRKHMPAGTEL